MLDLDPARGHEQAGRWPALVVSADEFNHGPAGMVVVVPITTRDRGVSLHVRIEPGDGGLPQLSFAKSEDVRPVSTERLLRRMGRVSPDTIRRAEVALRVLLDL